MGKGGGGGERKGGGGGGKGERKGWAEGHGRLVLYLGIKL